MAGAHNASYGYDLNGNAASATGGKWRNVAYTSFNLPDGSAGIQGPAGSPQATWQYDENHQRIKETRVNAQGTRVTWNLHPDNQGGLGFEREIAPSGAQSNRHYLSAGGATFAVLVTTGALPTLGAADTQPPLLGSVTAVKLAYWHKDQQGSLIATTDHAGAVTDRYAYDPFGKRRYTSSSYDAFGALVVDWTTDTNKGDDRGYTGHEHLDELGVIHMNGRIFDPLLGRFMQGDPHIQDPENLQNFDRYAYCYNNPLVCTDPTGYKFRLGKLLKSAVTSMVLFGDPVTFFALKKIAHSKLGYQLGSIAIGVFSTYCPIPSVCVGLGQAAWSGFAGQSLQASLRNGVISGLTAEGFNQVGNATTTAGQQVADRSAGQIAGNIAGHAAVGCASAVAGGGSCRGGALSGAFGAALSNSRLFNQGTAFSDRVIATVQHSIAGGVGSVIGGGTFENGAVTGAFGYLFNELLHQKNGKYLSGYETRDSRVNDRLWQLDPNNLDPSVKLDAVTALNNADAALPAGVTLTVGLDIARSEVRQNELYAQGLSGCQGLFCPHVVGLALDVYQISSGKIVPLSGFVVDAFVGQGFRWGGAFKSFVDPPHFERPNWKCLAAGSC